MNNRRTQPPQSIDGFALRRRKPQVGATNPLASDNMRVPERFLHDGNLPRPMPHAQPRPQINASAQPPENIRPHEAATQGLRRSDIDASLNSIDESPKPKSPKRRWRPNKKFFKRLVLILLFLAVLVVGYVGIKAIIASGKVFNGSIFDLLGAGQQLKADQYGRSNILVFGTSEDDPGHEAGELTDSIMIISIDQKNKNAGIISVPRDLWVKYGQACTAGYEGRINAVYECQSDGGKNQAAGAEALRENVSDNFGIDIQYYAQVNYTVVRQVVDAVGGVTVKIESEDPRGILDRNFDWKCGYKCYYVKHPNGLVQLDGEHALALARARNAAGGYGLPNANFDREKNQQKIITALKEKATNAGTLSNPAAVTGIIDALGDNVRTNFVGGEVKTLMNLAKDIPNDKIKSISLVEAGQMMVTTGNINGQSIVRPVVGIYNFSEIQSFVRKKFDALNGGEAAEVAILNGSTRLGVASSKAKELKAANIAVSSVGDTDANNYPIISWYDLSGGKQPKTAAKLKEVLGVASTGTKLPAGVQSEADFVIIIGDGVN